MTMNEKIEADIISLENSEHLYDIYNNPAVQGLLGAIFGLVPGGKDAVDAAFMQSFETFQKKKLAELFDVIMEDQSITVEDVKDVTVILEFAKLINVTNHLSKNGKIKYLGNLMRYSISEIKDGNVDEFEERLNKLEILSEREILLLETLYKCEDEKGELNRPENRLSSSEVKEAWKLFKRTCVKEFGMNDTDITAAMFSVMRTGFCIGEWSAGLSNPGTVVFYTTPEYHRFREKIYGIV